MQAPDLRWAAVEVSAGPMLAAITDSGVAALTSTGDIDAFLAALRRRFPSADARADDRALAGLAEWLRRFLAGERHDLPEVDLRGIPAFDAAVYGAVRAIPAGATASYGDVAVAVGSPQAARAVGGALARCPLFPAVPCHRVVRASDGWSGWGGGNVELKRRLLAAERHAAQGAPTTS
jgi:O-6-methylguanine DNA methyltransferase